MAKHIKMYSILFFLFFQNLIAWEPKSIEQSITAEDVHFSVSGSLKGHIPLPSRLSLEVALEYTGRVKECFKLYKVFFKDKVMIEALLIDANIDLITQKINTLLKDRINYENDVKEIILLLQDTSSLLEKETRSSWTDEKYYIQSIVEELTTPICIEQVVLYELPEISALKNAKSSLENARFFNKARSSHPKPHIYFTTVLVIIDKAIKQIEIFPDLYAAYYQKTMESAVETLEILKCHLERTPLWKQETHIKVYTDVCNALSQLRSGGSSF